jgi:hypothetical protein
MGFFDKFKRDRDQEVTLESIELPMSTLARWYLYDMQIENPEVIASDLGLVNISEEGSEKERQDSDDRIAMLSGVSEFAEMMAEINASVIGAVKSRIVEECISNGTLELDEEELELLYDQMELTDDLSHSIGLSAIMATLSIGINTGLLQLGPAWATEGHKHEH